MASRYNDDAWSAIEQYVDRDEITMPMLHDQLEVILGKAFVEDSIFWHHIINQVSKDNAKAIYQDLRAKYVSILSHI